MQRRAALAVIWAVLLVLSGQAVSSSDAPALAELHALALEHDAELQAARHRRDAGKEALDQGRASLMPKMDISAKHSRERKWSDQPTPSGGLTERRQETATTRYQASLTQPLFRCKRKQIDPLAPEPAISSL